ncbi:MAG: DUF3306 domain-containing protein [Silicimonas sp.]|nr:DUF3306 domain-containing protein [Silicimonas sp.]
MSGADFWSRRRAGVAQEAEAEEAALVARVEAEAESDLAARDDAELLEEAGLPEPETLDSPEAVREFLNSALPQRLKTRALRRLWRLNPLLANLDGLVDYGEDYTDAAMVVENLQTAYQVGKGMLAHIEALAEKAAAAEAGEIEEEEAEDEEDLALAELPDLPVAEADPYEDFGRDEDPEVLAPQRRSMVFSFPTSESEGAT